MHIFKTSISGDPNVGLHIFCNNKIALVGKEVTDGQKKEIQEALKVPVHSINIAGTSLAGVFIAGNDDYLLVPQIIFDEELEKLKSLNLQVEVLETRLTALGNNILVKGNKALVNPEFSKEEQNQIKEKLHLESVETFSIEGINIVGALAVHNNKGAVFYAYASKDVLKKIESFLEVPTQLLTANMGSAFVKSVIAVNDNGFIIGELSGGPEIIHIDEAFGFLEDG